MGAFATEIRQQTSAIRAFSRVSEDRRRGFLGLQTGLVFAELF